MSGEGFLDKALESSRLRAGAYRSVSPMTGFREALQRDYSTRGYAIIVEYKRCSPSRGFIAYRTPLEYIRDTVEYATAYSVLTEPEWFCGSIELIPVFSRVKPVLMKDFIVDGIQVGVARDMGASAILLIKPLLGDRLGELCKIAHNSGLDVLVEVDSIKGVEDLYNTCPGMILGVNSRNLKTLKIDFDKMIEEIRAARRMLGDVLIVAESGITSVMRAVRAINAGANALLIGTAIMSNPGMLRDIASGLSKLRS